MRTTIKQLLEKKDNTPIVMATAYDAWMAGVVDEHVDAILVGDSLGMVVQGHDSTIPVTMDEMVYHSRMVARGSKKAFIICDLPFMSYQSSVKDAVDAAGRCLKEGAAQAVKLEGGVNMVPQIKAITSCGIPVVGHLGLTPQSINMIGSYKKQAKSKDDAKRLLEDAKAIAQAGASMIVVENIPHDLAEKLAKAVPIPIIGIGAGGKCDGQVQVFHDLFGLYPKLKINHVVKFADCGLEMEKAIASYAEEVRSGRLVSK